MIVAVTLLIYFVIDTEPLIRRNDIYIAFTYAPIAYYLRIYDFYIIDLLTSY